MLPPCTAVHSIGWATDFGEIVYATRVANIRTGSECNECQKWKIRRVRDSGCDSGELSVVAAAAAASPFGIRIALASFRFHFGKQLSPEIASGKRANAQAHAGVRAWMLLPHDAGQGRDKRFFAIHSLALKCKNNGRERGNNERTNELVNCNWTRCWLQCILWALVHFVCDATQSKPGDDDDDNKWRRVNMDYDCCDKTGKELEIEIASSWASIEKRERRTPRKTQKVVASVVYVCVSCVLFATAHDFDSLRSVSVSTSLPKRITFFGFIHMAKQKVRRTHRAWVSRARNVRQRHT